MTNNQTWSDLGVDKDICEVLIERSITSPFPIQTLTIPDALSGRDVCGKAKTGSGKTLAFGIPMIQNLDLTEKSSTADPRVLMLVPTRELAVQVSEELFPITIAGFFYFLLRQLRVYVCLEPPKERGEL